jgi:hypothetical protein
MSKWIFWLWFLLLGVPAFGQSDDRLSQHQLSADWGSYRNRYLYPITDIQYRSPVLDRVKLRFSARLRAYGTLFFVSRSAYDLTPLAEYCFAADKRFYFSAGIGMDVRIRLVNDVRSEAKSSAEPLMSVAIHGHHQRFAFDLPLWTRLYANGINFTLLPEASYQIGKRVGLFLRYELSRPSIYGIRSYQWRQDCFVGAHIGL